MRKLSLAGALGTAAVCAALFAPQNVQAQVGCSGCLEFIEPGGGSHEECGLMGGSVKCSGGSGTECYGCSQEYPSVPASLTPDGGLAKAYTLFGQDGLERGATLSGVSVLRVSCSGAIVVRRFTDAAARRARTTTATLAFR